MQAETGLMQLRLHPAILALRSKIQHEASRTKYEVDLNNVTARGRWYDHSWYGADEKSGGIATAVGFHYFDMLHFLFGSPQRVEVHLSSPVKAAGYLEFEKARVRWFMSLDVADLPNTIRDQGDRTHQSITVNGEEIDFSKCAVNLFTLSYKEILAGRGFGLEDNRTAIDIVSSIRNSPVTPSPSDPHLLLKGAPLSA